MRRLVAAGKLFELFGRDPFLDDFNFFRRQFAKSEIVGDATFLARDGGVAFGRRLGGKHIEFRSRHDKVARRSVFKRLL